MKAVRTKTKTAMDLRQMKEAVSKLPVPGDYKAYSDAVSKLAELQSDVESKRAALADAQQCRRVRSIESEAKIELSGDTATAEKIVTAEELAELRRAFEVSEKKVELQQGKIEETLRGIADDATAKGEGLYAEAADAWCEALVRFIELNNLVLSIQRHYSSHGINFGDRLRGAGVPWLGDFLRGRARAALVNAQARGIKLPIELPDASTIV